MIFCIVINCLHLFEDSTLVIDQITYFSYFLRNVSHILIVVQTNNYLTVGLINKCLSLQIVFLFQEALVLQNHVLAHSYILIVAESHQLALYAAIWVRYY